VTVAISLGALLAFGCEKDATSKPGQTEPAKTKPAAKEPVPEPTKPTVAPVVQEAVTVGTASKANAVENAPPVVKAQPVEGQAPPAVKAPVAAKVPRVAKPKAAASAPVSLEGIMRYTPLPRTKSVKAYLGVEFSLGVLYRAIPLSAPNTDMRERMIAAKGKAVRLTCLMIKPPTPHKGSSFPVGPDGAALVRPSKCAVKKLSVVEAEPAKPAQP
jgi:hypothetical protein